MLEILAKRLKRILLKKDSVYASYKLWCEQADFASGTSSKSSRFIHVGLRYLEQGAFRLVYESLAEREALIKLAPHLVKKIQCSIPIHPDYRSYNKMRLVKFVRATWLNPNSCKAWIFCVESFR